MQYLDEHDGLGVWEVNIGQILQDVGIIDGGVAVRHLDVAPAFERREQHEQVGRAIAFVLIIDTGCVQASSGSVRASRR
jgi:hypothetical protein